MPKGGSDTFTVAISGDTDDEEDGKIIATLVPDTSGTPVYSVGAAPAHRAEVVVEDDDETFSITATATETEGNVEGDNKTLAFVVTLSGANTANATVDYQVGKVGDSADIDSDYTVSVGGTAVPSENVTVDGQTVRAARGTLRFNTGDALTQTITIEIVEDTTHENDESFTITLSNATGGTAIKVAEGVGTIENDDTLLPDLSIADATEILAGTSANFVVYVSYIIYGED